ncbi:cupredoxin domain-containing protein [Nocardiopsis sp. NRRL B-16309]|uniref:cupredoxin domain-containing protein n=1 Tax=Nocardiopsis sp. NRRL B-16309 TaxID=1519494 RepID=UPI0006ADF327|nr:cupredoxin domain-containing protein [Nocardiopsis sp. NRRL B-16309]
MSRLALIALAAAATLGLAACSSDDQAAEPASEETAAEESATEDTAGAEDGTEESGDTAGEAVEAITVTASEMAYDGIPETLPAGTVEITFDNAGEAPHDLVVEELGDEQVIPLIDGGESTTGTVTLEPGTYTFYCSVGSHRSMGMEQTVTVE